VKHKSRDLCSPREAADRLGVSVTEVERLLETGQLPGLMFLGDPRWFTYVDSVERLAREAGVKKARRRTGLRRSLSAFTPRS
jgi:excisionase family DNA binding protein